MSETTLSNLESQIGTLLESCTTLKRENRSLRRQLSKMTQERAGLLDKNKRATSHLKRILLQLKDQLQ